MDQITSPLLPISVTRNGQQTATDPSSFGLRRASSTSTLEVTHPIASGYRSLSTGIIQRGSNNTSKKGGQDATRVLYKNSLTISSGGKYLLWGVLRSVNGEDALSFHDQALAADRQSAELLARNTGNLTESPNTRNGGSSPHGRPATPIPTNIIDVNELLARNTGNLTESPNTRNGGSSPHGRPATHEVQNYSNPKSAKLFVGIYGTIVAVLALKYIATKHSPFNNHIPFMAISIGLFLLAALILLVMYGIHDHSGSSSDQLFSSALYYVYHILSFLAICFLLPLLFNPHG